MARAYTQGYCWRNRFINHPELRRLNNTEARRLAKLIYRVAKKVGWRFLR